MQHVIRLTLVAVAAAVPLSTEGAEIQQVSACTYGPNCCAEGCNACYADGCNVYGGNACYADPCYSGYGGSYCDPCGNGRCGRYRCSARSRARDFALNWCGPCGPIGRPARRGNRLAQKLCWCCTTKAAPDSGWAPPAHTPIRRTGGWYQNYWPSNWYGNPGGGFAQGAPMVYQPTDTTQLGYSYARVPTWRPDPTKIPPVPYPSDFHNRACPCQGPACGCFHGYNAYYPEYQHCPSSYCPSSYCPTGNCYSGYTQPVNLPASQSEAGLVRMMPAKLQAVQATHQPAPQPRPQVPVQQVSAASETTQKTQVATQTQPKRIAAARPAPAEPVRRSSTTKPSVRKKSANRSATKKQSSGGWFGLPSLREMTF